jgi:hypothetical protein
MSARENRIAGTAAIPNLRRADMPLWIADWTWSLPLILLTVVINVFGLGIINERVVRALSHSMDRRRMVPLFALVMGAAILLMTALHGIEGVAWAAARGLPLSRRRARCQVGDALFIERDDHLRPRECLARGALADDGCFGGAQRHVAVRADHRLSIRNDPGGLAARPQEGSSRPLRFLASGRAGPAQRAAGHWRPAAVPRTTGRAPESEISRRQPTGRRHTKRRSLSRCAGRRARSWQR